MEHIRAFLRVRPLLSREKAHGEEGCIAVQAGGAKVSVVSRSGCGTKNQTHTFDMDCCLGPDASQEDVFRALDLHSMCDAAFEGKAATVMCFGQTGSGKTYTMSGSVEGEDGDPAEDGIQFEAVRYVSQFRERIQTSEGGHEKTVKLRASYFELYNERINDLLNGTEGLKCRWSKKAGCFFVENLMIVECLDLNDFILVLREGQARRKRASHLLNDDSSRSHLLFTVYIEVVDGDKPARHGKLTFVDLAGSERLHETGGVGNDTKSINRSLFALGNVIERLSKGQSPNQRSHIPYRSSVLTQLLMNSLDGGCRTALLACVTPSSRFVEESLRTIYYAQRAQKIQFKALEMVDATQQEMYDLKKEICRLQEENLLLRRALNMPETGPINPAALRMTQAAAPVSQESQELAHAAPAPKHLARRLTDPSSQGSLKGHKPVEILMSPSEEPRRCYSGGAGARPSALDVLMGLPNTSDFVRQRKLPLLPQATVPKTIGFHVIPRKNRLFGPQVS
uniref:Kinesin-like protein n=1 Tax=Trypanosoma congolense (strain IL3000) TaxID=1068625 RepID=G0UQC5_TRYCI|nr:putative kinesin [Trypanosoma congolense IL3000]